jgi:hypothetical protein
MARGDLPALAGLTVADQPAAWTALGFALAGDGTCPVGGVGITFAGSEAGEGILHWSLRSARGLAEVIDGIPATALAADAPPAPEVDHPNGVVAIDHVVVATPDLPRTLAALQATGMEVRRIREASADLHQAFLWAGEVIIEVVGPPRAAGSGPAALWGLTLVAADLAAFERLPGRPFGPSRDAVQPGRRIVTSGPTAGTSVRLAVMTPHRPAG